MRRFRPFLLLFVIGCAAPEKLRAYREEDLSPGDRDIYKNLRSDRNWEDQEQMMGDVRSALGKSRQ